VYGTFQAQLTGTNWDQGNALPFGAAAHEGGTLYTTTTPALEEGFYEYKYIVVFDADDEGYYGGSAEHGLPKVIAGVRAHLATGDAERRDAFPIVIEHLTGWDAIHVANTVDATGCCADEGYWRTRDYLRYGVDPRVMRWLDSASYFEPGRMPVMYIGNHDHETPTHYAGGRDRWHRLQPYLIALFTSYWPSDRRTPYDNGYGVDADRQTVVYHRWGHATSVRHRPQLRPDVAAGHGSAARWRHVDRSDQRRCSDRG
jgi:hypothetical protein